MEVKFWGTRGSLPVAPTADAIAEKVAAAVHAASGRGFADLDEARRFVGEELPFAVGHGYGGATSCVEIAEGNSAFFICDMGSGLRDLGIDAMRRCGAGHSRRYNFFMSHFHWDHIMGFPFFAPAFDPLSEIVIFTGHDDAEEALRRQQDEISFPVPFDWLRARIEFRHCAVGQTYTADGMSFELFEQQHSHKSFGYRFTGPNGRSVIYSTDSEHKAQGMEQENAIAAFFRNADLVICDTMYSLAETVTMKEDWGHSSNLVAIDLCRAAGAARLVLFHHEPSYSDHEIDRLHRESIRYEQLTRKSAPLEVLCSYDGLVVTV